MTRISVRVSAVTHTADERLTVEDVEGWLETWRMVAEDAADVKVQVTANIDSKGRLQAIYAEVPSYGKGGT